MKMVITVVSSLLVGLSLASSNFSPIQELQHFLLNKKRIFYSLGLALTGYLLLFSALIISLVEGALQYDAQGFLIWSALFAVASVLGLAGLISVGLAKLLVPARLEQRDSIFKDFGKQFGFSEALEMLLKRLTESREAGDEPAAQSPSARRPEAEEKFSELRHARAPVFGDAATADVLHH
jgi:hypothetical protein